MFEGLRTLVMRAEDLQASKEWYSRMLGKPPYLDTPYYVGFNVGGFELGLHPGEEDLWQGVGSITYWGVPDVDAALKRLVELGAREHGPVQDVGGGIRLASVLDPFGQVVGIIENSHFKLSS